MYDNKRLAIKAWAEDDRPREKMLNKGSSSLSNAELLAIVLGSGSRESSALDLAKTILNHFQQNLLEMEKADQKTLEKFKGVGRVKAINIQAVMELARRIRRSEALVKSQIKSSKEAYAHLEPIIAHKAHEEFWVLYLNNHNRLLEAKCISKGGLTGTLADSREVFRWALDLKSTAMILAHNHPSGGLDPSQADKQLTRKMVESGQVMDIAVLDHLIITDAGYFSFSDEGLM